MISRRNFLRHTAMASAAIPLGKKFNFAAGRESKVDKINPVHEQIGAQRISSEKLHQWEALEYGMFIHFGMSTLTATCVWRYTCSPR